MKPFIITLTGPSACGKGLITDFIIDYSKVLQERNISFYPFLLPKDVTRSYRITEAVSMVLGKSDKVDVNSVSSIPAEDDLVYRTYGDEYAINSKILDEALNNNRSPIVVINDVRVVEEIKRKYHGRVLSLFIFRDIIPDIESHKKTGSARGGVSEKKVLTRYEKAVALYRVFIENIHIFDRVVLNVGDLELAQIQARGIIDGIISGKISLNKKIEKGPKLFIVSGNAASGKDDIIQAAKNYGKLQTDILIKTTSRWEEEGDVGEIICQYVPAKKIINELDVLAQRDQKDFNNAFTLNNYEAINRNQLNNQYESFVKDNPNVSVTYEQFVEALYKMNKMEQERMIPNAIQRFWIELKAEQEKRMVFVPGKEKKELPEQDYKWLLSNFFEKNDSFDWIDLDRIRRDTLAQQKEEEERIEDSSENKSWLLQHEGKKYIFYENNLLYGEPIKYGFEIDNIIDDWSNREKHLVLTASLPNMFRICREQFGASNVITAFTYSKISAEEHEKNSDKATGGAKSKEYNDIIRYAKHIADFDYALIFAETSLTNLTGGQKDELVDQMFRLFRVYNK